MPPFNLSAITNNPFVHSFLNQGLSSITGNLFPGTSSPSSSSFFGLPRGLEQLGGAASLIGSLTSQPKITIPDFASFATPAGRSAESFLQRSFESPPDPFAPRGEFASLLGPIRQQESDVLKEIATAYSAAFPARIGGVRGPELQAAGQFGARAAANRQALASQLAQQHFLNQQNAASRLLGTESLGQREAFQAALQAEAAQSQDQQQMNRILASLGLSLLMGNQQPSNTITNLIGGPPAGTPGATTGGPPGQPILGTDGASLLKSFLPHGQMNLPELARSVLDIANRTGDTSALEQLLASGRLAGQPFPFGVEANTPAGQIIQQGINRGLVESPAAKFLTSTAANAGSHGIPWVFPGGATTIVSPGEAAALSAQGVGHAASGGGLLGTGTAGLVGSGIGAAGTGFFVGNQIGQHLKANQATAGLVGASGGAASGAAVGALIADGPGAVIGAIVGGLAGAGGGVSGRSSAVREQKKASIQAETQATGQQRPGALQQIAFLQQSAMPVSEQVRALKDNALPAIESLVKARDAGLLQRIQAIAQATGDTGVPINLNILQGANPREFLDSVADNLASANNWRPSDNPESNVNLLKSSETGRFGFAFNALQNDMKIAQTLLPLATDLIAYLQQRGVA